MGASPEDFASATGVDRALDKQQRANLEKNLRSILPGNAEQLETFINDVDQAIGLYFRFTRPMSEDLSHRTTRLKKVRRVARPFASAIRGLDRHVLGEISAKLDHRALGKIIACLKKVSSDRAKPNSNALARSAHEAYEHMTYLKMAGAIAKLLSDAIDRLPSAKRTRHRGNRERVTEGIEVLVEACGSAYQDIFGKAPSWALEGTFPKALRVILEIAGINVELGEKKLDKILAPVRESGPKRKRGQRSGST